MCEYPLQAYAVMQFSIAPLSRRYLPYHFSSFYSLIRLYSGSFQPLVCRRCSRTVFDDNLPSGCLSRWSR